MVSINRDRLTLFLQEHKRVAKKLKENGVTVKLVGLHERLQEATRKRGFTVADVQPLVSINFNDFSIV